MTMKANVEGLLRGIFLLLLLGHGGIAFADPWETLEALEPLREERLLSGFPPFTQAEYRRALAGETVVTISETPGRPFRTARGMKRMALPPQVLWSMITDRPHFPAFMPHIVEGVVIRRIGLTVQAYHYLDIPLPFVADRHWVVKATTNGRLYTDSGHRLWEAVWRRDPTAPQLIEKLLEEGRITRVSPKQVAKAVLTAENEGGWLLVALEGGKETLVEYISYSDPGGDIPQSLAQMTAKKSVRKLLDGLEAWGRKNYAAHYGNGHDPVYAPDGTILPFLKE
ncbi:MAG: hypothetical protein D6812_08745 [Deltaproteobacteria bacterium]|nr:MAG: hypothetical protein D6812_08745 [Deltaproteobacteria bacterium]